MKISDFTQDYIDLFREKCNFTDTESQVFEYKRKKWTDIQISMEMNMSESNVQAIMRKVRYQMNEISNEAVYPAMQFLCDEISEFLHTLYNHTDTRLERSMLRDMIYDLNNENWNE